MYPYNQQQPFFHQQPGYPYYQQQPFTPYPPYQLYEPYQQHYQQPIQQQQPYYPHPYYQQPYYPQQGYQGGQPFMNQFKKQNGQYDFPKMMNTVQQITPMVKQMGSLLNLFVK
ncbi:YppG family protein [Guptibacillus hwajinpoensis]|uniref:YppG family protein n=1 Tax=Guptibacillus hwajinpoensis TaxID=208199 RepID=UPI001CFD9EB9|nr:YppG family protein [Pseudalkalibacillus hwajinpoensis]WLR59508.1 YppG family protein [Pseudalkalibacillus hwajinpoensis]